MVGPTHVVISDTVAAVTGKSSSGGNRLRFRLRERLRVVGNERVSEARAVATTNRLRFQLRERLRVVGNERVSKRIKMSSSGLGLRQRVSERSGE